MVDFTDGIIHILLVAFSIVVLLISRKELKPFAGVVTTHGYQTPFPTKKFSVAHNACYMKLDFRRESTTSDSPRSQEKEIRRLFRFKPEKHRTKPDPESRQSI